MAGSFIHAEENNTIVDLIEKVETFLPYLDSPQRKEFEELLDRAKEIFPSRRITDLQLRTDALEWSTQT